MKVSPRPFTAAPATVAKPEATTTPSTVTWTPQSERQDVFVGGARLQELKLQGSITDPKVQISGMAWHGDQLVLLPQWAKQLYVLDKADVTAAVDGRAATLTPRELKVGPEGFGDKFPGFEGFEAIAIVGERAYLVAEAKQGDDMFGYLVAGRLTAEGLELDLDNIRTLPTATRIKNMGYEALLVAGDRLMVMPESNGGPRVAHAFSLALESLGSTPMAPVDYRLTDSTPADADGRFWVANYHHPGDKGLPDAPRTEELLPMQVTARGIESAGAPLHIALDMTQPGRNWEAVAKLDDRGFLVMTDEFPRAIFGFVPKSE